MQAVILAAGEGERLGPLTETHPKPMIPVGNQPILESVLEAAIDAGVEEVVFVVGHAQERIGSHFGDGDQWGVQIQYVEQSHRLGAAHALSQVESIVDDHFLVLHGDQMVSAELLARLLERWSETQTPTIAAVRSARPTEYGAVTVEDGLVRAVSRTPTEDPPFLVNGGAYVFDGRIFGVIRDVGETEPGDYGMATALQYLCVDDGLTAVVHNGSWQDLTYPWDLLGTNAALVHGQTSVSEAATVHDSAVVAGDVAVDSGVSVGPNATLLPGTSLGANVTVGANATVANSIVMAGARIGDGATLRDCIVGEATTIGPNGTVDGGPADVLIDDRLHRDVGLGGVVAGRTTLGGAVTVTPGTVVGREVRADSGTVLGGRIESGETVRRT